METFAGKGVLARHIFYNETAYDNNDAAANALDDDAIDPSKSALLPGGQASFENYIGFNRGIVGIMVDIPELADPDNISADDFDFKVGNTNDPDSWTDEPPVPTITVREGAGDGGSDRITIIWPANSIVDQWLRVEVLATANTGLISTDVHYWGSQVGETGNVLGNTKVNSGDITLVVGNLSGIFDSEDVDNRFDLNKDKKINSGDITVLTQNLTFFVSLVIFSLSAPLAAELPDEAVTDPDVGVADYLRRRNRIAAIDAFLSAAEAEEDRLMTLKKNRWRDNSVDAVFADKPLYSWRHR